MSYYLKFVFIFKLTVCKKVIFKKNEIKALKFRTLKLPGGLLG